MYRFYRQGWWVVVLCMMMVLVACAPQDATPKPPQLACDSIISPDLLALAHDVPEADLPEWVSERYGERGIIRSSELHNRRWNNLSVGGVTVLQQRPDSEAIRIQTLSENILRTGTAAESRYAWMWQGALYTASYHKQEDRLLTIDIEFHPKPTLADLERCYGTPEYYKSTFYTHDYEWTMIPFVTKPTYSSAFTLYYPEQGLTFSYRREGDGHTKPTIDMNTTIETGTVSRAGTLLDLMIDRLPGFSHAENEASAFTTWEVLQ